MHQQKQLLLLLLLSPAAADAAAASSVYLLLLVSGGAIGHCSSIGSSMKAVEINSCLLYTLILKQYEGRE